MRTLILALLFASQSVLAAQVGKVIVDGAAVREFPQANAKVIGTLPQGTSQTVSNLPTEGFFKTKLSSGEMGWISGNDIRVGGGSAPAPQSAAPMGVRRKKEVIPEDAIYQNVFRGDNIRIQLGYGIQNLAYGGLSDNYSSTVDLNYGKNFGFEFQKRISQDFQWALRAEMLSAKTGNQAISTSTTQTLEQYAIPVQAGLIYSPIYTRKFRLGLGAYLGSAVVSYTTVSQTNSSVTNTVKYSSMDLVGTGAAQAVYSLGRMLGVYAEIAYHYQKTGDLPASTVMGKPSFKLNYSGMLTRFGLELRF